MIRCAFFAAVLTVVFVACARVEYAYRHDVAGIVVDAVSGAPLAGVVVDRIEDGHTNAIDAALYRRITAADGAFRFVCQGLGGRPEPSQRWILAVARPGYRVAFVTNEIRWRGFTAAGAPYGYILTNLRVRLGR